MEEWLALPDDRCGIVGCDAEDTDQRGPLFMRDGTIHKLCPEYWEAVMRILGGQQSWEADAHHHEVPR